MVFLLFLTLGLVLCGLMMGLGAYADALPETFESADALEAHAREFAAAQEIGFGKLVHPVRASVTGRAGGPPLFDCLILVGREKVLERLRAGAMLAVPPAE